jgi:hypothetical protein
MGRWALVSEVMARGSSSLYRAASNGVVAGGQRRCDIGEVHVGEGRLTRGPAQLHSTVFI